MSTQECGDLHPLLSLFLEDKLSEKEKAQVAHHLSECEDARAQMEEYRSLRRLLLSAPEPVPPVDLHERILEYVYETPSVKTVAKGAGFHPWLNRSAVIGLAAAALALALFFNLFSNWRDVIRRSASAPEARVAEEKAASPSSDAREFAMETAEIEPPAPSAALPSAQVALKKTRIFHTKDVTEEEASFLGNADSLFASGVTRRVAATGLQAVSYGDAAVTNVAMAAPRRVVSVPARAKAEMGVVAAKGMEVDEALGGVPIPASAPSAPEAAQASAAAPLEGKRWSGVQSSYPDQHTEWVRDPGVLTAYWQLLGAGPSVPSVDFQKEGVALIFLGTRPTGGYAVSVDGVSEGADAVTVLWHEVTPAGGDATTQAVTRPWALQTIPKTDKPVVFIKR